MGIEGHEEFVPEPRMRGMVGPATPDEFPDFGGWRPPVVRSMIEMFTIADAFVLVDLANAVVDRPACGAPAQGVPGFDLFGIYRGQSATVVVRLFGRWMIATVLPEDLR